MLCHSAEAKIIVLTEPGCYYHPIGFRRYIVTEKESQLVI